VHFLLIWVQCSFEGTDWVARIHHRCRNLVSLSWFVPLSCSSGFRSTSVLRIANHSSARTPVSHHTWLSASVARHYVLKLLIPVQAGAQGSSNLFGLIPYTVPGCLSALQLHDDTRIEGSDILYRQNTDFACRDLVTKPLYSLLSNLSLRLYLRSAAVPGPFTVIARRHSPV
jgi:hypothetical protein